jgi:hypothetical protein
MTANLPRLLLRSQRRFVVEEGICDVCFRPLAEHNRDGRYNHSAKGRARRRSYNVRRYDRLRDEGLCTQCGGEEVALETLCVYCKSKKAFYDICRVR